jgi:O-antigen/teichoic acid export membrane protein
LIGVNAASALHYGFQAMMGRHLSIEEFGKMNAVFQFFGLIALPVTIFTSAMARRWAELERQSSEEGRTRLVESWKSLLMTVSIFVVAVFSLLAAASPWVGWWFQIGRSDILWLALAGGSCAILFSAASPYAMARQWFGWIAIAAILGAILRISMAWLGISLDRPFLGALLATSLYPALLLIIVLCKDGLPNPSRWKPSLNLLPAREFAAPSLVLLTLFFLSSVDLIVVSRVHSPETTGVFSQVMILARTMLFLVGPLSTVIFPKAASGATQKHGSEQYVVRKALTLGLAILVPAAGFLTLFAPQAIQILTGTVRPEVVLQLRLAVWCLLPVALAQLVLPALFARRQERWLFEVALIGALLPLGLIIFDSDIRHAYMVEATVGSLILVHAVVRSLSSR